VEKMITKCWVAFLSIVCFLLVIFVTPIIPIESIETKTRIVKYQYDSEVYAVVTTPRIINVTNNENFKGSFSVTANVWYIEPLSYLGIDTEPSPFKSSIKKELFATDTQEKNIEPKSTATFHLPENWIIVEPMYTFDYEVDAPLKQENYNLTITEYKSLLELITQY
jgi:hypothetical protein